MSEKIKLFGRRWGTAYLSISIYLLIDVLTNVYQFLLEIKAGTVAFTLMDTSIFLTATLISLLNILKAAQSKAWHNSVIPDTQPTKVNVAAPSH